MLNWIFPLEFFPYWITNKIRKPFTLLTNEVSSSHNEFFLDWPCGAYTLAKIISSFKPWRDPIITMKFCLRIIDFCRNRVGFHMQKMPPNLPDASNTTKSNAELSQIWWNCMREESINWDCWKARNWSLWVLFNLCTHSMLEVTPNPRIFRDKKFIE